MTSEQRRIALEESSRRHWQSWKLIGNRTYLYQYRIANIKIRRLKGEYCIGYIRDKNGFGIMVLDARNLR